MREQNIVTVILPGNSPRLYDLDMLKKEVAVPVLSGGRTILQKRMVVRLGRGGVHGDNEQAPGNDIVIEKTYSFVSRAQCTFQQVNGVWFIVDDRSRNKLVFQNQAVSVNEMHDGDKYYLGEENQARMVILFSSRSVEDIPVTSQHALGSSDRFLIGRDPECDIVINHPMVSRKHCLITKSGDGYYIEDNHSKNGVLLNGLPLLEKHRLEEFDKITVAGATLFFSKGEIFFNEPKGGISVTAENLYKKVGRKGSETFITQDVTLSIRPNEFVAIIGGSGAGKTTLLDCLSGMTDFTSGDVLINGERIRTAGKSIRSLMGYVPQQDIVYDKLSVERMLYYSAKLRMPRDSTVQEIQAKVDEALDTVELTEHRKTMISKLSGGQRKRVSIAVELLASPKLFFLDEPSSGLDPGTEKHLMQMLKALSQTGKTVIMVTHTVQNIDLCDKVICMGRGGVLCYEGSPSGARKFFGKEQFTDIYDDLNDNSQAVSERWKNTALRGQPGVSPEPADSKRKSGGKEVRLDQFLVMTARYAEILRNSLPRLLLLLGMPAILTLLVCFAYQADGGLYRFLGLHFGMVIVRNVCPFLDATDTMSLVSAFSCAAFWTGIFNSIQEVSKERNIFEREKFTGVSSLSYLMSKCSVLTALCIVQSAIMTGILWIMGHSWAMLSSTIVSRGDVEIAIPTDGVMFTGGAFSLEIFLTVLFCVLSAMCLGLLISSAVSNDLALVLCPICLLPQILFSGVATTLSGFTETISNIISCRWSCIAMLVSLNVNDMLLDFGIDTNYEWTGTDNIGIADYDRSRTILGLNPVAGSWLTLIVISLVCLVAAWLVLRFIRKRNR